MPKQFLTILFLLSLLVSCTSAPAPTLSPEQTDISSEPTAQAAIPTATPEPPRTLTVCMGSEPASLFLYGDGSAAARGVREAIYDGPFDVRDFEAAPVILEKLPTMSDGDVFLEPVQVSPGDIIIDAAGNLTNLAPEVSYLPSGCQDGSCAAVFTGPEPVSMDQMVARFRLLPGLQWSDGAPLTADDSLYSFEVARSLYPGARSELIARTQSYQTLDDATVEWRGVPGLKDPAYRTNFFTPLPRHAWGTIPAQDLLMAEPATRMPLGWGPYVIREWTPGDHISLDRNPNYFRSGEGLPAFDHLVFRFGLSGQAALDALATGECDYLDKTTALESQLSQLQEQQAAGQIQLLSADSGGWEHLDFGIVSLNPERPALFNTLEARQAVAMCVDRQRLVNELFAGASQMPSTYVPSSHPLFNPDARQWTFDPQAGANLLQTTGWLDLDGDPNTPRVAQGVAGVADGTPFAVTLLTTTEEEKQQAAEIITNSLAQCGIQTTVESHPWEELLAAGPEGPVFGRDFSLVQYGWTTAIQPACGLYLSSEIPGPYPQYARGWGGANASGFSSAEFDAACRQALNTLPDTPEHSSAHAQAQALFAEQIPSLPLYLRPEAAAARPDFCVQGIASPGVSWLWALEAFNYGEKCTQ